MATNSASQERQLILMEKMSKRLDSIQESQKKLEETNARLLEENTKLKNDLAKQERQQKGRRTSRSSRRDSNVEIPSDLRVRYFNVLDALNDLYSGF